MSHETLEQTVLRILGDIAPDVDPEGIDPQQPFRDQFDFDSMDTLNFAIALHKALGVDIPEADYPRIGSLNGCIEYLQQAGRSS
jgi:acyl carrier protein